MKFRLMFVALLAVLVLISVGCGQGEKTADDAAAALEQGAEKAAEVVEEVAAGAEEAAGDLMEQAGDAAESAKAMYDDAAAALAEKKDELVTVQEKIAGLSAEDLLSSEGEKLKENAETLTSEISTLETKLREMAGTEG